MQDRELVGKWRFTKLSKKLRKKINRASKMKLALKIDPEYKETLDHYCGTVPLHEDCPFYVLHEGHDFCLAPLRDSTWRALNKQFISPSYSNDIVMGCYILPFCQRGLEAYQRMQRWSKRALRSIQEH